MLSTRHEVFLCALASYLVHDDERRVRVVGSGVDYHAQDRSGDRGFQGQQDGHQM